MTLTLQSIVVVPYLMCLYVHGKGKVVQRVSVKGHKFCLLLICKLASGTECFYCIYKEPIKQSYIALPLCPAMKNSSQLKSSIESVSAFKGSVIFSREINA